MSLKTGLKTGLEAGLTSTLVESEGSSSYFPTSAAEMATLVGYTPNHMWTLNTSSIPIADDVGSMDLDDQGSTYNEFEVATLKTGIVGYRPDSVVRNTALGGVWTTDDNLFDRGASAGSFFWLWNMVYKDSGLANQIMFGSGGAAAVSDSLWCFSSSTNGFAAISWRDQTNAVTQTQFHDGMTDGAQYSFIAGYDASVQSFGMARHDSTTGNWSTASASVRDEPLVMNKFVVGGRESGTYFLSTPPSTNIGAITNINIFNGAGQDGWKADKETILAAYNGNLPADD